MQKVKLLDPTLRIIGVEGKLRILKSPKPCHGKANGCVCPRCKREPGMAKPCQCQRPWTDGSQDCLVCGKPIVRAA